MGEEKWKEYALWPKRTGKGARDEPGAGRHIRHELITFRAILRYAAYKHLLPNSSVPKGKVLHSKARREAFIPPGVRISHYAQRFTTYWNALIKACDRPVRSVRSLAHRF